MKKYFTDLHLHIGRSMDGSPIKITAARDMTLANLLQECLSRKGINIIGIVDAGSPKVQQDISHLITEGSLTPLSRGGLSYFGKATLLLGAEVETGEVGGGTAHSVCFFPTLNQITALTGILKSHIKNINLSSQRARITAGQLLKIVDELGGILIPAHIFTPHKSILGNCAARLEQVFGVAGTHKIFAVELGLSSDSYMADRLAELKDITFLSNSDAHSLPKIGREYNIIELSEPNFEEILLALKRQKGRRVAANYGLDPRLGKYHRTHCLICEHISQTAPPVLTCEACGSEKVIKGVLDRIEEIADCREPVTPAHRPAYHYQVPMNFVHGIGRRTIDKLLGHFGTEMEVLHSASQSELASIVGEKIAANLCLARSGKAELTVGGGGRYGKMLSKEE